MVVEIAKVIMDYTLINKLSFCIPQSHLLNDLPYKQATNIYPLTGVERPSVGDTLLSVDNPSFDVRHIIRAVTTTK